MFLPQLRQMESLVYYNMGAECILNYLLLLFFPAFSSSWLLTVLTLLLSLLLLTIIFFLSTLQCKIIFIRRRILVQTQVIVHRGIGINFMHTHVGEGWNAIGYVVLYTYKHVSI